MVREGLCTDDTEQRPARSELVVGGEGIPGRGNCNCEDPEGRPCPALGGTVRQLVSLEPGAVEGVEDELRGCARWTVEHLVGHHGSFILKRWDAGPHRRV